LVVRTVIKDVAAFHRATDTPVLDKPQIISADRMGLRWRLIDEEVNTELVAAMAAKSLPDIADAIADSIYVLVGTALEYGIPLDRVWNAVQAANMAKVDPVTGLVRKRTDGKILKPDGWLPPDIAGILQTA
jgi:predicted HAD superfamily Cof-like phosphohydrolase